LKGFCFRFKARPARPIPSRTLLPFSFPFLFLLHTFSLLVFPFLSFPFSLGVGLSPTQSTRLSSDLGYFIGYGSCLVPPYYDFEYGCPETRLGKSPETRLGNMDVQKRGGMSDDKNCTFSSFHSTPNDVLLAPSYVRVERKPPQEWMAECPKSWNHWIGSTSANIGPDLSRALWLWVLWVQSLRSMGLGF